jgi:hypothetical protein
LVKQGSYLGFNGGRIFHGIQVAADREMPAACPQDDQPQGRRPPNIVQRRGELFAHLQIQNIARSRAIERYGKHPVLLQ